MTLGTIVFKYTKNGCFSTMKDLRLPATFIISQCIIIASIWWGTTKPSIGVLNR